MLTRHVQRATWFVGAILAAFLFFLGGAALRLMMGPISLGPFAGAIEDSLNHSISGLVVRFDRAVLEWSRTEGKINLIVLGTKVFDLDGRIVAQAPKADLDFDATSLIQGRLSLRRLSLIGVQLTGVRSKEGVVRLGFGAEQGAPDILKEIGNILRAGGHGGGSLQSFAIRDARLAFSDEPSGLFVVSPNATFTLDGGNGKLNAALDAAVEISGVPTRVVAHAELRDNGLPEKGSLDVHGLSFAALAKNSPVFAGLMPYKLVSDLVADFALDESGAVISTGFHISGAGQVEMDFWNTPLAVDKFAVAGHYLAEGHKLSVETFDVASKQASAKGKADLAIGWNDSGFASVSGDVNAENVRVELPELFREPLRFSKASFKGGYDLSTSVLTSERLSLRAGALAVDLSGRAAFPADKSPALKLAGTIGTIPMRELMRYWPSTVAQGAFRWIDENISEGRLGPLKAEANFPAGMLDSGVLPDESMSVSFPFEGTTIRYVDDVSPVTGVRGEAQLRGSTFHAAIAEGHVGPLNVKSGDVLLTQIHVRGSPGYIKAHVDGAVPDVLALIDQGPLGYPSRLGLKPASTSGQAAIDMNFVIPMRRDVTFEEVRLGVEAKISNMSAPLDEKLRLEQGDVILDIDAQSLLAQGKGTVSGIPARFAWSESFDSEGDSTRIDVDGVFDDHSRSVLGLSEPSWVKGEMPFTAQLTGRRFHFTDAAVEADATSATAEFPIVNLVKRAGTPANLSALMHFAADGAISVPELTVSGGDMLINGALELDTKHDLTKATFSRMRAGTDNDFAADITASEGGGLDVKIEGSSFDASRLFAGTKPPEAKTERVKAARRAAAAPAPAPAEADSGLIDPLTVNAKLERVVLKDNLAFRDVLFGVSFRSAEQIDGFSLDAMGPGNGKITGRFKDEKGARSLALDSTNAGDFIRAFTGFNSIRGGTLSARISLPAQNAAASPAATQYSGTVELSNIVVTDQPFIARLFAAGSLDGPLHLLKGDGISVSRFNAPFAMRGKTINVKDGRFSGPAIGATFEGTIDRGADRVDIAGSLVPVFGLNSMLGAVPVLGDLFVSKQGEGIFGLTYAMRGDLNEPTVAVNPLSVLTPGIFRRIFEFSTPKEAPQASTAPTAKVE